jgi:hypothetical protein
MNETNATIEKLKHIQQLWIELGRTKLNTAGHETLMAKIRLRSAEYQALIDAQKNPKIEIRKYPRCARQSTIGRSVALSTELFSE